MRSSHHAVPLQCVLIALLAPLPLAGQTPGTGPVFDLPIACTPGADCWVVNYVDVLAEKDDVADFRCGTRSYEGHKGTDIAVRDLKAMEAGVDVIAAAPGKVLRVRDGEADKVRTREELAEVQKSGRECGNGVLVEHGGGWQTMYCHMREGSIVVHSGDNIASGAKLGLVGHSGFVEFPHVHLGVTHQGRTVDPFTGLEPGAQCAAAGKPLWREALPYEPVSLYAAGFRNGVPKFEDVQRDAAGLERLAAGPAELTFWTLIFGVAKDDAIRIEIRDPEGRTIAERDIDQERTRARQFYFAGRRLPALGKGVYTGTVVLTRRMADGNTLTQNLERKLTVE